MPWNFGDMLDAVAGVMPHDAPAVIHQAGEDGKGRKTTWGEFDKRTNNLAKAFLDRGAEYGDKVAFYMRNRPEYVETFAASFKARLVHVNVNYRYTADELHYIFDNSDAAVIVYGSEFRDLVTELKDRLGKVKLFVEVSEDGKTAPFAVPFEELAGAGNGAPLGIERSPDDMLFLYTGGTTGMPKGVMWRAEDLREAQLAGARKLGPVGETLEEHLEIVKENGGGSRIVPACPLMHGTGLFTALGAMINGGCVITLDNPHFDPHDLWQAVSENKADQIAIVGDAFAKPMLAALEEKPDAYDLSSVLIIISSGVMWSMEVKQGLLKHIPQATLVDSFGSSEGIGFGTSYTTIEGTTQTAKFTIGDRCKVFDENDELVEPGSGKPGVIALTGPIPSGYYKDPEKTAKTFKTIDGVRYSIPGDWCTVEEDGTLTLLGRGSVCINTAGEKVYPEEVEEVLKLHPAVEDALVVGVPDDKWGQAVTGVVHLSAGSEFDEAAIRSHVREHLAGYKTPKRVLLGTTISFRAPNGKADYKGVANFAKQELGAA